MIRTDARTKVTGGAIYGTDLFEEGLLFGALVLSPVARGRIVGLDVTAARAMAGVVAVVGAKELPSLLPKGGGLGERPVFPPTEIAYRNQPVAAVAAETLAQARAAARAVVVRTDGAPAVGEIDDLFPEWPETPPKDSPHVVAHVLARGGDLTTAIAAADLVHSETYRTGGVHQMAIEPHACVARVDGDRWFVRTSTQSPFGTREDTADLLGLPQAKVVVEGTWVGGGFGGKAASFLEPYALVLAAAAHRPVKLSLSYREEFLLGRCTLPTVVRIDTAVKDGTITGRRVRLLLDSGASLPGRDFQTGYAIGFTLGPYRVGSFEIEGYALRTNKPPYGPHRAPLAPQCAFVVDSHMDSLARRLGVDPIDFRLRHAWREGDRTSLGQKVGPFGLVEALTRAKTLRDRWRGESTPGQGFGVGCGFWSTVTGAGGEARLLATPTKIRIVQGEREIGSGSVVGGLANVAARALGLPASAIEVRYEDTSTAPYDSGVFGSRTVGALGQAVQKAAVALLKLLAERLGTRGTVRLNWSHGEVVVESAGTSHRLATLLTRDEKKAGGIATGGRHYGRGGTIDEALAVDGSFYPYYDFSATVALVEVRVDLETGQVVPLRVASFPDVGVALDRGLIDAQVEGGVAMGLGTALTEEMLWGPDGKLANPGLLDYRIPTLGEVPPIEVDAIEGFPGAGPFGAKGVGEPPIIPLPAAVANAVTDATGARVYELPLTAERVARALKLL
ncbi:MAG TPA: xanthine dehydrogenase family protein molybdopterin-binding subunit [Thermoplasmata archaeon]